MKKKKFLAGELKQWQLLEVNNYKIWLAGNNRKKKIEKTNDKHFAKFSRRFHKFFDDFVASETCRDLFGPTQCTRTRLDTFRSVQRRLDVFGILLDLFNIFRACARYRRSQ